MFKIGWLLISFFTCTTAMAQTAKVLLPQFNYWELSAKLIQSPELAEQLDVNPDQIAALKAMRARPAFRTLLEVKMKELRTDARFGGFSAETLAWNQLDDVVKKEMAEIFAAAQLSGLRRLVLREYYPFGFSPFEEINVRRYIDLPQADSAALDAAVTEAQNRYKEKTAAVTRASCKKIVSQLPNTARERFSRYLGFDYLSGRPAPLINEKEKSAYPKKYRVISLIGECVASNRSEVAFTPKQIAAIERIHAKYTENLNFGKPVEYLNRVSREAQEELESTLSEIDFLTLAQLLARLDFEHDFRRVFGVTDPIGMPAEMKFCEFLQLEPVQQKSILDAVDAEWKITTASLSNLQNEIFAELVQTLRKEKQPPMRAFFADVW